MTSSSHWHSLLSAIRDEMRSYGQSMQPPCDNTAIKLLSEHISRQFGAKLPAPYASLLREANGVDWNGLSLYAVETSLLAGFTDRSIIGIVEANELQREGGGLDDYLVLGEDGTVIFAYHIPSGICHVLTRVGLDVLETHPNCDSLIAAALAAHR